MRHLFTAIILWMTTAFAPVWAQTTTEGKEFWLGFMHNYSTTPVTLDLYISSRVATSGTVSMPLGTFSQNFTVVPGTTTRVNVPVSLAMPTGTEVTTNMGIRIIANDNINVVALNSRAASADASCILPIQTLGQEYYVSSHFQTRGNGNGANSQSELLIVAVENSTQVQVITPVATAGGRPANTPFNITLNAGQTYQIKALGDLTGTKVTALNTGGGGCKNFAVFGGNMWTRVGECNDFGDHLYKQMFPVNTWGKNYITVPFQSRNGGDMYKIVAAEANTQVRINGGAPTILNAGQVLPSFVTNQPQSITADKPIMLTQYSQSESCDNPRTSGADPFMLLVSPNEQMLTRITFNTLFVTGGSNITRYYLNVVTKAANRNLVTLTPSTGTPVNLGSNFVNVPANTTYAYSQYSLAVGQDYTLASDSGFIAYVYGYGSAESIGYAAGSSLNNLNVLVNISPTGQPNVSITNDSLCVGNSMTFTATADPVFQTFTWNFGDGTPSVSGRTVTHTYANPGEYQLSITASTGAGACTAGSEQTVRKTIRVLRPRLNAGTPISGRNQVCANETYAYTANGLDATQYRWIVEGGTLLSGQNTRNASIRWDSPNPNARIRVIPSAISNCVGDTVSFPVRVNILRTTQKPAGPDTVCTNNLTRTYQVTPVTGYGYQWRVQNGTIISGQGSASLNVTWAGTATGKIWLEPANVIDSLCFLRSDTLSVFLRQPPTTTFSITGPSAGSAGQPVSFTVANAHPDFISFSWNMGDGTIKTGRTVTHTYLQCNTSFNITVTASTAVHVCQTQATASTTFQTAALAGSVTGRTDVCTGTLTGYRAQPAGQQYFWFVNGGTIVSGAGTDSITVSWGAPNPNGRVAVVLRNSVGCASDTARRNVRIRAFQATQRPVGPDSLCSNAATATYSVTATNGYGYQWRALNGNVVSGQGTPSVSVAWTGSVPGKLWLEPSNVVDSLCFSRSDTLTVNFRPALTRGLTIVSPDTVCVGQTFTLTANGSNEYISFVWRLGDGAVKTGRTITHTYTTRDLYPVRVRAQTAAHVCFAADSTTKNIRVLKPQGQVIVGDRFACAGEALSYTVNDPEPGNTYQWFVTGGSISAGAQSATAAVTWGSANENAEIRLLTRNAFGCFGDTIRYRVRIRAFQTTQRPVGPDSLCSNAATATYSVTATNGYGYQWRALNGNVVSGQGTSSVNVAWTGSVPGKLWLEPSNVVDSLCFSRSDTLTINFRPALTRGLTIVSPDTVCVGQTFTLTANGSNEYISFVWRLGDGAVKTGRTITHTYTTRDLYPVRVRAQTAAHVCFAADSTTKNIRVLKPQGQVIVGDRFACAGEALSYTVNDPEPGNTYQWFVTGGSISAGAQSATAAVTWGSANENAEIRLLTRNAFGCFGDTIRYRVRIRAIQPTQIPVGPDSVCTRSMSGIVYSVSPTVGYGYQWNISGGTLVSGQGTPSVMVNWTAPGIGQLWLSASNVVDSLCFAESTRKQVVIKQEPTDQVFIRTTNDTLCAGVAQTIRFEGDPAYVHYRWEISDGSTYTTAQIAHTFASPGTYTVRLIAKTLQDVCAREQVREVSLTIVRPDVRIFGPVSVCPNALGLAYYLTGTRPRETYQWTVSGGTIVSGQGTDTIRVNWGGTNPAALVQVVATDYLGCNSLPTNLPVRINRQLTPVLPTGPDTVCSSNPGVVYEGIFNDNSIYSWQVQNGSILSGQGTNRVVVRWDPAATSGTIRFVETSSLDNLCTGTSPLKTVLIEPAPDPNVQINALNDACVGQEIAFSFVGSPLFGLFDWNFGDGTVITGTTARVVRHTFANVQDYTVRVTARTGRVCQELGIATKVINIQKPSVIISGDRFACAGDAGSVYTTTATGSPTEIRWIVEGGVLVSGQGTAQIAVNWGAANLTTARVRAVPINALGCVGDTANFGVRVSVVRATQTPVGEVQTCANRRNGLQYRVTPTLGYGYQWNITGGTIVSGQGTAAITVNWDNPAPNTNGNGQLWLSASNVIDTLCFAASARLNVLIQPGLDDELRITSATITPDQKTLVSFQAIGVKDTTKRMFLYQRIRNENGSTTLWQPIKTLRKNETSHVPDLTDPQKIYEYKLESYNDCGDTVRSYIHNTMVLTAVRDEDRKEIQLRWNDYRNWGNGNPFGDVQSYKIIQKVDNKPDTVINLSASASSLLLTNGLRGYDHCFVLYAYRAGPGRDTAVFANRVCVSFEHLVDPRTLFTPNNDGINETFVFRSLELYPNNQLLIFNRWGQKIFEAVNYRNNWTGNGPDGVPLPDGTYFFILQLFDPNAKQREVKGSVTIMR